MYSLPHPHPIPEPFLNIFLCLCYFVLGVFLIGSKLLGVLFFFPLS